MAKWLTLAWPACYINSMIKFLEGKVALAFRTKLTDHALQKYARGVLAMRGGWIVWLQMHNYSKTWSHSLACMRCSCNIPLAKPLL